MKYFFTILILATLVSCNKTEKEYYSNGNLKFEISLNNSKYEGIYREYYEDGNLRIEGDFLNGLKQGMFAEYYKANHKFLKSETLWKDDTLYYQKNYNKEGKLLSEGELLNNIKISKWKYYDSNNGYLKEVQEFFNINDSTYLNQNWILSKKGDTLNKGNHYQLISKDTVNFEKQRVYFFLKQPYFSYKSDLIVCLPRNEEELKENFENEYSVEWDTIDNLANRFRNQGKYENKNHDVVFDLDYQTSGKKRLRGVLIEKQSTNNDTIEYDFVTRKIYFDREIYIEDN